MVIVDHELKPRDQLVKGFVLKRSAGDRIYDYVQHPGGTYLNRNVWQSESAVGLCRLLCEAPNGLLDLQLWVGVARTRFQVLSIA